MVKTDFTPQSCCLVSIILLMFDDISCTGRWREGSVYATWTTAATTTANLRGASSGQFIFIETILGCGNAVLRTIIYIPPPLSMMSKDPLNFALGYYCHQFYLTILCKFVGFFELLKIIVLKSILLM